MTPLQYCEAKQVSLNDLMYNADRFKISPESYIEAKLPTRAEMNELAKQIRKYGHERSTCGIIKQALQGHFANALLEECKKHWIGFVDYSGVVGYPVKGGPAAYWNDWGHDYTMSRVVFSEELARLLEGPLNDFFEWKSVAA